MTVPERHRPRHPYRLALHRRRRLGRPDPTAGAVRGEMQAPGGQDRGLGRGPGLPPDRPLDVEGSDRGAHVRDPGQGVDDAVGGAVMEQPVDQALVGPAGEHEQHLRLTVRRQVVGQLGGGPGDPPVRALDHLEGELLHPEVRPRLAEALGPGLVDHGVHNAHLALHPDGARRATPGPSPGPGRRRGRPPRACAAGGPRPGRRCPPSRPAPPGSADGSSTAPGRAGEPPRPPATPRRANSVTTKMAVTVKLATKAVPLTAMLRRRWGSSLWVRL